MREHRLIDSAEVSCMAYNTVLPVLSHATRARRPYIRTYTDIRTQTESSSAFDEHVSEVT